MSLLLTACTTVVLISTPCDPGVKPIPGVFVRSAARGAILHVAIAQCFVGIQ